MNFPIDCSTSTSVWTLRLNPITGTAKVRWFNTPTRCYTYQVSRREALRMLWNSKGSIGQWINQHCHS
jgi:hypothetical protein